ncbi:MAG TPA: HIT domain-containing protein [Candidatus Saccharimonadales bacterium]|nr:HIT domain-containing protein [Candidatus Saccharimonadales bacterium]
MDYSGSDFYCDIAIPGKIELQKEYESENVLAFHHTKPFWQVHIVVVPKKHIPSLTALSKEDEPILLELLEVLKKLAANVEKGTGAARIVTNLGDYQDSKHLHFHVSSGKKIN